MNKKATILALALLTFGMTFSATAQTLGPGNNATDDPNDERQNGSSNVTVSIASKTAIDVKPENLDYSGLSVGTQTEEGDNSGNTFGSIELENIGSEYIDRIWAEASAPDSDPFGTGNPDNYDAGNFLQVRPSNATAKTSVTGNSSVYHYVNRKEFSSSWTNTTGEIPSYIEADPSVSDSGDPVDSYVGRLRAGDEWYFYTIYTGVSGSQDICDGGGSAILRVGNTPHSSDQFGTVDFTTQGNTDYTEYDISQTGGTYGVASGGPGDEAGVRLEFTDSEGDTFYREYDILTVCDTDKAVASDPHVIRTRYNVQAGDTTDLTAGAQTGSRAQFLLNAPSSTESSMLLPGEGITVDTAIEVPQGVPAGPVQEGQLTFYVTSDEDASVSN